MPQLTVSPLSGSNFNLHRFLIIAIFGIFAVSVQLSSVALAATQPLTPQQSEEVRRIIREYFRSNPEILLEAIEGLKQREQAQGNDRVAQALKDREVELLNDSGSPVGGNPNGDITLVEFFDYRCPYCKRMGATIESLLKGDEKLRFIYKEWPILGEESVYAARAALAARTQGKYEELHKALMAYKGTLDQKAVLVIAMTAGLNMELLKQDIERKAGEVDSIFARNFELARALEIQGTPAFVVGDTVIRGAVDVDTLKKAIKNARGNKR